MRGLTSNDAANIPAVTRSPLDSLNTIDRRRISIGRDTCFIESSLVRCVTNMRRYATHYAIYCHGEKKYYSTCVGMDAKRDTCLGDATLLLSRALCAGAPQEYEVVPDTSRQFAVLRYSRAS